MEPAFIIRHFAGKVKYQIKVRGRCDGHKKTFPCLSRSLLSGYRKFAGNELDQKGSQRYFRGVFLGGGVDREVTLTIILNKRNREIL